MTDTRHAGPILIVEDDRNIAALVDRYLAREGFLTIQAHDGNTALSLAKRQPPLMVILDVMLPGLDGWEVCRALRRESDVPILMLTAREAEMDRVVGLSIGADDYVIKPFSPRELVERVKAILRRVTAPPGPADGALAHGELKLDPESREVTMAGAPVALTPSEFLIMHVLMGRPGKVFSRDELLSRLHRDGVSVIDRVIDVHVGKLRHKIEPDPSKPQYIRTVHGVGYRFAGPSDA